MKKTYGLIAIVLMLTMVLSGCGDLPENDWLQAPDWSRSEWVGNTANVDGAPFVMDEDSDETFFLMASTEANQMQGMVRAFDATMNLVWETRFEHVNSHVSEMRIVLQGDVLHTFWVDGFDLFYGSMTTDGEILREARMISGELSIARLDVVSTDDDEVLVWASGNKSHEGIYQISSADDFVEFELLSEIGFQPRLRKDSNGDVHAIFISYADGLTKPKFYYDSSRDGELGNAFEAIAEVRVGSTSVFYGPWIGVEDELVYVFWAEKITTGMTAGMKNTFYLTMDMNTLAVSEEQKLSAPYNYQLPYDVEPEGMLISGNRFDLNAPADVAGGYVTFDHMQTNVSAADELALIAEVEAKYKWRNENYQVAIEYFDEGVAESYQLLTFTSYDSHDVFLRADADGYLHASWTEDNSMMGHTVYYATTEPSKVAVFSELDWTDYRTMAAEIVFEVLAGVAISPLVGAIYMVAPLLIVAVTSFLRRAQGKQMRLLGTLVSLGLAIVAYETIKPATLPGYDTFVPFSPWIRNISVQMGMILQKGVPILIGLIAAFVGWWFTYQKSNQNAINFIMLYVATNVILSMMLYGLLLYYAV